MRLRSYVLALPLAALSASAHAPAPRAPGFADLFNGKNLNGWEGDPAFWSVQDGAITGRTTAVHPAPHNTFLVWTGGVVENFELRLKFRIVADNVRGWANSGVQYRSRLTDSANWVVAGYQADLDLPGDYVGTLYEERGRGILARPPTERRNAIRPGQWNDYVIIVEGNHHRYYVNGKLTLDATDPDETRAATSGLLALQLHAGPPMTAQFKEIRLKRLGQRAAVEWPVYGGGPESIRYSSLTQINRETVKHLTVAWTFDASDGVASSELEVNPIVLRGVLYATTVSLNVVALNAATGELLWRFDPYNGRRVRGGGGRTRGVTYWSDGQDERIFVGVQQFLYALDAKTGRPVPTFGSGGAGRIDMRDGLRPGERLMISLGTPGIVYKDLLIIGSRTAEALPTPPGDVRAYDVRTGALRWTFHTIPRPGELGYETWPKDAWTYTGAANNWTGMSLDARRGLVFVPTGSAADDYYGANRAGDNLFANSLIALNAETGKRVWHFQFVRHDVWDRDLPAPPNLVTVRQGGRAIDAVAQVTKSGHLFLFARETGRPLFPIRYRGYAKSDVEGEVTADSQPLPLVPEPFARQAVTEDMLTDRTPEAHRAVLERFRTLRSGGQFVPASLQGTIVFPGLDGGAEWGGAAVDPETSILYVNANEMPWTVALVERTPAAQASGGQELYTAQCAGCHGADRQGSPPAVPSLVNLSDRLTTPEIRAAMSDGSGRMPGFAQLGGEALSAIQNYILSSPPDAGARHALPLLQGVRSPIDQKYRVQYGRFLDPDGYPGIKPPWGTLSAIDLATGRYVWKIPLGEYRELAAQGLANTGCENYGGPVVTAGGLVFIGATNYDNKFRAFDKTTGALLWETTLPAAGNATPATYEVNGRQFVVIATSSGKSRMQAPARYIAFALEETRREE
ncbi:MAG TPA: family 16 glycoside hydrolase [Gemmatimonadales bacterium]|nr:family 16 glycoside hydrolase [Gemmatimonadales bacterium]